MEAILALMIPFGGLAVGIFAIWTHHKRKMVDKEIKLRSMTPPEDSNTVRKLEERVRVLERVITDDKTRLAEEIEDLRSEPTRKELN